MHVYNRGNNRTCIFVEDADREVFLRMLKAAAAWHNVFVHEFVLMTTHFHLIATPGTDTAMAGAMKQVCERYSRYFNRRHRRTGTLWEGRYRAKHLLDERHWLICSRYIVQNPVRARIVATPGGYRWSSYRVHAECEEIDWIVSHPAYLALGSNDDDRRRAFRAICAELLPEADLIAVRSNWALPDSTARPSSV
jgi:putative transposase